MKALKIEPGKAPERINVANELASLQSLVGGYIEVIYPDERRPVGLICNEEGKCCGLELNRALYKNGKPYDIIAGTFLVVGLSAEDFADLREEDAAYFEKLFRSPEGLLSPRWFLAGCKPRLSQKPKKPNGFFRLRSLFWVLKNTNIKVKFKVEKSNLKVKYQNWMQSSS